MEYSTEELRKRKALTDAIVANLQIINSDENPNLEDLAQTSANICHDLEVINKDENNLDELEEQTGKIVANLATIDEHEAVS